MQTLFLEAIHPATTELFQAAGWSVRTLDGALSPDNLVTEYQRQPFHVLGIRSKTKLTATVLSKLPELIAVGCFCIGVDQVDLVAAANRGVAVFNSPFTSSRSVAELVIGYIISLKRRLVYHNRKIHTGQWSKTAQESGEIQGNILGIIGYGHIGSQLSILAEALGMKVIFYDIVEQMPFGGSKAVGWRELLQTSDIITLHVPSSTETRGLIGRDELKLLKSSALVINASRGSVLDLVALRDALLSRRIAGAAIDVYPEEPRGNGRFDCILAGLENVILTPHIGGATQEAQYRIATDVAGKLLDYWKTGRTRGSVNFPELDPRSLVAATFKIVFIHQNKPGILNRLTGLLSENDFNICGQLLGTIDKVGYAIIAVTPEPSAEFLQILQKQLSGVSIGGGLRLL
jgi:D-3-phosphoglycerate dehydrogenase / 2-oxoglutarate reductase